jgi:hypothetical protein
MITSRSAYRPKRSSPIDMVMTQKIRNGVACLKADLSVDRALHPPPFGMMLHYSCCEVLSSRGVTRIGPDQILKRMRSVCRGLREPVVVALKYPKPDEPRHSTVCTASSSHHCWNQTSTGITDNHESGVAPAGSGFRAPGQFGNGAHWEWDRGTAARLSGASADDPNGELHGRRGDSKCQKSEIRFAAASLGSLGIFGPSRQAGFRQSC